MNNIRSANSVPDRNYEFPDDTLHYNENLPAIHLTSGKKLKPVLENNTINTPQQKYCLPMPLALERHSTAPAALKGSHNRNISFLSANTNYARLTSSLLQSPYNRTEPHNYGRIYSPEKSVSTFSQSDFSTSSLSSIATHTSCRGQDGIVELIDGKAIKKLHQKIVKNHPDCCIESVETWNKMYNLLGINELATAVTVDTNTYIMPRIMGKTLAEQNKTKDEEKNILREMKSFLLTFGIKHSDLINEIGTFTQHNPKNIIFSELYNRYLPIDVEGVEIMDMLLVTRS